MTLDEANQAIRAMLEQMSAGYGRAVFDEWMLVSFDEAGGRIHNYSGPRRADLQMSFKTDFGALRKELLGRKMGVGDFEFARHAGGPGLDAFMILGRGLFLICNNTTASMDAIAKDPRWLAAQVPFVEFSDRIRANPLLAK